MRKEPAAAFSFFFFTFSSISAAVCLVISRFSTKAVSPKKFPEAEERRDSKLSSNVFSVILNPFCCFVRSDCKESRWKNPKTILAKSASFSEQTFSQECNQVAPILDCLRHCTMWSISQQSHDILAVEPDTDSCPKWTLAGLLFSGSGLDSSSDGRSLERRSLPAVGPLYVWPDAILSQCLIAQWIPEVNPGIPCCKWEKGWGWGTSQLRQDLGLGLSSSDT